MPVVPSPFTPPPELYVYPDPILTKTALVAAAPSHDVEALVARMLKVMHTHRGVGLAAPQVGVPLRVVVIDTVSVDQLPEILVNPVWTPVGAAGLVNVDVEGCLSVPGALYRVPRFSCVDLTYKDMHGDLQSRQGVTDFAARVIQHECDHLDGKLINDGRFRRFGGGL